MEARAVVGAVSELLRAEHRHAAYLAPAMGIGLTDVLALYHLANEPLTAGALADRVGLSTGSVTALVDRLETNELAARTPDTSDRRVSNIEMTANGHARTFAALEYFIGEVEQLCAAHSLEDQVIINGFRRALTEIVDRDTERLRDQE